MTSPCQPAIIPMPRAFNTLTLAAVCAQNQSRGTTDLTQTLDMVDIDDDLGDSLSRLRARKPHNSSSSRTGEERAFIDRLENDGDAALWLTRVGR